MILLATYWRSKNNISRLSNISIVPRSTDRIHETHLPDGSANDGSAIWRKKKKALHYESESWQKTFNMRMVMTVEKVCDVIHKEKAAVIVKSLSLLLFRQKRSKKPLVSSGTMQTLSPSGGVVSFSLSLQLEELQRPEGMRREIATGSISCKKSSSLCRMS